MVALPHDRTGFESWCISHSRVIATAFSSMEVDANVRSRLHECSMKREPVDERLEIGEEFVSRPKMWGSFWSLQPRPGSFSLGSVMDFNVQRQTSTSRLDHISWERVRAQGHQTIWCSSRPHLEFSMLSPNYLPRRTQNFPPTCQPAPTRPRHTKPLSASRGSHVSMDWRTAR